MSVVAHYTDVSDITTGAQKGRKGAERGTRNAYKVLHCGSSLCSAVVIVKRISPLMDFPQRSKKFNLSSTMSMAAEGGDFTNE